MRTPKRQRTRKPLTLPHRRKARWKMATNVRALRLAVVMTLSSAALTACGEKIAVATKPPAELLTCADEPVAPDLPPYAWDWILAAPSVADAVSRLNAISVYGDALSLDFLLTFFFSW